MGSSGSKLELPVKVAVGVGAGIVGAGLVMIGHALGKQVPFSGNILIDETTFEEYSNWKGVAEYCIYQKPGRFSHASAIFRGMVEKDQKDQKNQKMSWTRIHLVLIRQKWFVCVGPMQKFNEKHCSSLQKVETDFGHIFETCVNLGNLKTKTYNYINNNCRHFARQILENSMREKFRHQDAGNWTLKKLRKLAAKSRNDFLLISHEQMNATISKRRLFDWVE